MRRSEDPDRSGQDRLRGELPEEPGAGVPEVERGRSTSGWRLLRAQWSRNRETLAERHEGVHPNSLSGVVVPGNELKISLRKPDRRPTGLLTEHHRAVCVVARNVQAREG